VAQRVLEVYLYSSKTSVLEGGECSTSRPGHILPPGKPPYPLYRRLGGPQGRSGRAENFDSPGIRSPDPPACSSVAIQTERPGTHMYMYRIVINVLKFVYQVGYCNIILFSPTHLFFLFDTQIRYTASV
jgi:hypothetical protein